MKPRALLFALIVLLNETSSSQNLPYLRNVSIKTRTTFDSPNLMFFYEYSLVNDQNNDGDIQVFEVDISRGPNTVALDTAGLQFRSNFERSSFRREYAGLASRVVPVGFPHLPSIDWTGLLAPATNAASFDCDTLFVVPRDSVSGFVLMSKGLPGIRRCVVLPHFNVFALYPRLDEVDNPDSLDAKIDQDREAVNFHGFAVGPTAPAAIFNGLGFIDTIKSYINRSRTLSWITDQSTADKYGRLIDSARYNLEANNRGAAKAKLDSVLLNANDDSSSTLRNEAYALLRFNTEYVLKKLREQDEQFASENASSSLDATAANSARHLAKGNGYLHEVFTSGGEIFYRRSTDNGSSWDQTHRLNTAFGENSRPCIAITKESIITIVWQRRIAPATDEVWYAYSQDNGESWSEPAIASEAGQVEVSGYQADGPMPVLAEFKEGFLVLVYSSDDGLRYRISEDAGQNWEIPGDDVISGASNDHVRFPSLAGGDSHLYLVYDYAGDENAPYSRTFDGSAWSDETSVAKGTDASEGAFASVAMDADDNPIAAWTGYPGTMTSKVIFRAGYDDNTWSDWFVEFGVGGNQIDWYYPSLTYYLGSSGEYSIAIVNHSSIDDVKLIRYPDDKSWTITTLSESGAWAGIAHESASSGTPTYLWTDQAASPYNIIVGSSNEFSPRRNTTVQSVNLIRKRRAVVRDRRLHATLELELAPMKVVHANGDTSTVPFKRSSIRQRGLSLANMWDYLGSDTVNLPPDARRLVVTKRFTARGPSIGRKDFSFRVLNANGVQIGVLDTTSTSGTVSVDIAPYAGMRVILRPQLTLSGVNRETIEVSVGDIFVTTESPSTQLKRQEK